MTDSSLLATLETNEENEAFQSLVMSNEQLLLVDADSYRWKWAIIALHNSLQNFMTIALSNGNILSTLKADSAKTLSAYWETRDMEPDYPDKLLLDVFPSLYSKIKSDAMKVYVNSRSFIATADIDLSVARLNSLRNSFIHYIPRHLILELDGLPKIAFDALAVIEFLLVSSGNVRFFDNSMQAEAIELIPAIRSRLVQLELRYDV